MLREKSELQSEKVEKLVKEEGGLRGLDKTIAEGLTAVKKFIIETTSKNETLKELEIMRKENIVKLEKIYEKTNSYLIMKRLIDVANEINEKYHYAVEEVENVYASNNSLDKKLEQFEEIKSITNSYYKIILEDVEKYKVTTS